jgi:acyl-coenzyme A thioesterase PaaI-like protein
MKLTEQTANIYQIAHGEAVFPVGNQACEAAENSFREPVVTLQHSTHFLANGKSRSFLEAKAKVTNHSNPIGFIEPRSWTNDAKKAR